MAEKEGLMQPETPTLIVTPQQLAEGFLVRRQVRCECCGHSAMRIFRKDFEVLTKLRDGNFAVVPPREENAEG